MQYEVVVVGGGIGGLTTAALLAARGVSVCLLERQPAVGGCVAAFERFGYTFEAGTGLYALWEAGEIHDRIFSELSLAPPEVRLIEPAYSVRLPDRSEVAVTSDSSTFYQNLKTAFPECAAEAVAFFEEAEAIGNLLLSALKRVPDLPHAGTMAKLRAFFPQLLAASRIRSLVNDTTLQHLGGVSPAFRRFVDAQLQTFAQTPVSECAYLYTCVFAAIRGRGLFTMRGGAASLAETLAASVKKSGGTIRLNAPALRLAYGASEEIVGVQLLSGETITASRAVVSNLTVWDTYGKLIGPERTPSQIRQRLKGLRGWGAYQLFLGVGEAAAQTLSSDHIIAVTDLEAKPAENGAGQLTFALSSQWDPRGPEGMRAATVTLPVDVEEWFTYHEDESEHEQQDQATLEAVWARLNAAIPELGDAVELIGTTTPRTWYETTRRRLGMVGGLGQSLAVFGSNAFSHHTHLPNLHLVGDTVSPGAGIAAVSHSALIVANHLSGRN